MYVVHEEALPNVILNIDLKQIQPCANNHVEGSHHIIGVNYTVQLYRQQEPYVTYRSQFMNCSDPP